MSNKSAIWSTERVNTVQQEFENTGVLPQRNPFYMGDIRKRKPRLNFKYTNAELLELAKVKESVIYFGEEHAKVTTEDGIRKVKLRDYQKSVLKQYVYYRHNVYLASRQVGKSMSRADMPTLAIKLLERPLFYAIKNFLYRYM